MPLFRTPRKKLPESPSSEETQEVTKVLDLRNEANSVRTSQGPNGLTLEQIWEQNGMRYLGDHWNTPGSMSSILTEGGPLHRSEEETSGGAFKGTINRTQNAIIAQRALAFERPETFSFQPIETLDEAVAFLKPSVGRELTRALQAGAIQVEGTPLAGFTPEQLSGTEPISDLLARSLEELDILPPDAFDRVNDEAISEAVQQIWDVLYTESNAAYYIATNELYASIFGHQPMLFQWEPSKARFKFSNPHILNVWIDPTAETVEDAEYVIVDFIVSEDLAKSAFPNLRDSIERASSSGELKKTRDIRVGNPWKIDFKRSMLTVTVAWVRHQDVPMTAEEALSSGEVVRGEDEKGNLIFVDESGRVLEPESASWPTTPGIRQITVLPEIERRVSSVRSPYIDIPVGWNKNIPKPYSPYGQGEPERVEDIQQAINRLFSILHRHARFYQAPMEFWPEDLWKDFKAKNGGTPYSKPGRVVPVRTDVYQTMAQLGGFGVVNQIPPMPSFYVQLLGMLLQEHDRLSGFQEVLQGAAPGPETSGRAIEALQSAARGPIAVKSSFTEWMLERLGRIGLDAIQRWLPREKAEKILSHYSGPALAYMLDRIQSGTFNVRVSVVSGRGVNEASDLERAATMYMQGAPQRLISRKRAMELSRISDVEAEIRQINKENRSRFMGVDPLEQAGQGPGAGQNAPQPSGPQATANGRQGQRQSSAR